MNLRHDSSFPAFVLAAAVITSGCTGSPLEDALAESRRVEAEAEKASLTLARDQLAQIREVNSYAHAGISAALVGQALNGFVGTRHKVVIGTSTATLEITSLQSSLAVGRIDLTMSSVLKLEGQDLQVPVVVQAQVLPKIVAAGEGQALALTLHLRRIEPSIKTKWFQWRLAGVLRDLALAAAKRELASVGDLILPLETGFTAGSLPTKHETKVTGGVLEVSAPGFSFSGRVEFHLVLPLPDGLHVFGRVVSR
ncbi:MAG: hypothetical protein O9327_02300 [Polaromonas sp.]|nr:hypothetical protein [Polaromonas sp.]